MKNNSFLRSALLLTAATAGAEATPGEASAAAPATTETKKRKAKPQHTITVEENDKNFLKLIQDEFYGPQASNPDEKRFLSTNEAFSVLMQVATNHRFSYVQKVDEHGAGIFDKDGQPEMDTIDNFEVEAMKIIEARDMSRKTATVSRLQAQIEALKAELAAKESAPVVEAETPAPVEA